MPSIFHDEAIELALSAHRASVLKYAGAPNDLARDAFFVLCHDSIRVHRAVGALIDAGWSGPAAALVRTLLDISVSAIAVAMSTNPRMAGFKYLYTGLRRHSREQSLPAADRRKIFSVIRTRLNQLPTAERTQALQVLKDRDRAYWFAPEWPNPSAVIEAFGDSGLRWVYMQMSAAAHGTFIGMRLFREDPDAITVNPDPVGPRAFSLDLASCRWLVEIVRVRDRFERLDVEPFIDDLVQRMAEAAGTLQSGK